MQTFRGRTLREVKCDIKVGPFPAMDYFGDGSLYILDSPGHDHGHICALARTTSNPDTFVLFGGDAAHHGSELRPTKHLPMPKSIVPNPQTGLMHPPLCPGDWFRDTNQKRGLDPEGPLYRPSFAIASMEHTLQTIEKIQEMDGNESVLCLLAHDPSVRHKSMPLFPESLNDWKSKGLRKFLDWSWVGDVWNELERNLAMPKST